LPYKEYFDFIICGDVIEHLRDPQNVIRRIYKWLKPHGIFVASIPNIRYWRILRDLFIFGKWEYEEAGILDNTHLRFFTRNSFLKILQTENFKVVNSQMIINGRKQNFANRITFGCLEEFWGSQVMVSAMKV
jgi:2-polyprenyl-3-methyl-5-hydroxy-6-metoxy-1,4-benzoquinol methylase